MANTMRFLDFAISLIFIFTLASLLCSTIMEWISLRLRRREVFLRLGLRRLIQDYGLYVRVVNHPSVIASSGRSTGKGGPSYLSGKDFALALIDSIISRVTHLNSVSGLQDGQAPAGATDAIRQLEAWGSMTARAIRPMLSDAQTDEELKQRIAGWYDHAMERISGAYKRGTQAWLFWLGLAVAGALNIDTLSISRELWRNRNAASAIVGAAERAVESQELERMLRESPEPSEVKQELQQTLALAEIPLGYECTADESPWSECLDALTEMRLRDMVSAFLGWLITAVAVSFGAAFWFELLAKIVNVRSAGRKPQ